MNIAHYIYDGYVLPPTFSTKLPSLSCDSNYIRICGAFIDHDFIYTDFSGSVFLDKESLMKNSAVYNNKPIKWRGGVKIEYNRA